MAEQRLTAEHKHHQLVQRDVDWLKGMLASLALRGFHGKITLHYEGGSLRSMVEERTHKPPK